MFSADHLVCVLLGHAGPSGDGRSSRLTAAWPERVWERDSASLTETDRTRLFNVLIKRISCREDMQRTFERRSITGLFHPVSIRNELNQSTYVQLDMHLNEKTSLNMRPMMHLWTGAFLNERR